MDFLKEALYGLPAYHLGVMAGLLATAPLVETNEQLDIFLSSIRDQLMPNVTGVALLVFGRDGSLAEVLGIGMPEKWIEACAMEALPPLSVLSADPVYWSGLERFERTGRLAPWASLAKDFHQRYGITFSGAAYDRRIVFAVSGDADLEVGPAGKVVSHLWPAIRRLASLLLCPHDRLGELDDVDVKIWTSVMGGHSYHDIAVNMGISRRTLTRRINKLLDKFSVATPEQLVAILLRP
ncbi:hypothetical protein VI06_03385 [Aquitalea magnusonii]|nr:hypothetical protein VI06_03385 [Aquitalea magnusonii]